MVFLDTLTSLFNEDSYIKSVISKRDSQAHGPERVAFAILIPVLVLLSGVFAGLTLGYMSLDETQLNVLSTSGTPKQKKYANQILPIRKNGHLLLITLILANMITNETLPVISDPVFGGGVPAVAASTALIVIFSEIIPQTLCTRYGLVIGARMAFFVRILIVIFWVIAYPVSKLLEWILGPHHGIIYRRSELKELIAMHADDHPQGQGGELKHDTAAIIGHTLDMQEKVVSDAMKPMDQVYMLRDDAVLDYHTLTNIHRTGHSRIPVYSELSTPSAGKAGGKSTAARRIIGVLLVKQCVLLDPEDATPLKQIPLNKVPLIAFDEPLLKVLDRFQEGRSHMAIVTRISSNKAASVKEVVKPALTRRFLNRFRDSDSSDSDDESDAERGLRKNKDSKIDKNGSSATTIELDKLKADKRTTAYPLEQTMPADALLPKANANKFLEGFDQYTNPVGIITLEDVLEVKIPELIGEEIYDEFDREGAGQTLPAPNYVPPEAQAILSAPPSIVVPPAVPLPTVPARNKPATLKMPLPRVNVPTLFGNFSMSRSRSAPGTPRGGIHPLPTLEKQTAGAEPSKGKKDALDHIREVNTPSPTEKNQSDMDDGKQATSADNTAGSAVSDPTAPATKDHDVPAATQTSTLAANDRMRTASQTPLPEAGPTHLPASLAPTPIGTRSHSPAPSMLAEAVLRGRQARASQADGTVTGTPRPSLPRNRFKSTRLEGAPESPVANRYAKKLATGETITKKEDQSLE